MSIVACSALECEKSVVARGLCNKHYKEAKRRGTVDDHAKLSREPYGHCSVDGCEQDSWARTWCGTHYARWRKTGTTADPVKEPYPPCKVEGCVNLGGRGYGMCGTHYARWVRKGNAGTGEIKTYKRPTKDGLRLCGDCNQWVALEKYNMNGHKTGPKSMCRDCERTRNVAWREANPTYWQEWQKANPQLVRDITNRRRAQKASGKFEKIDRDIVFERDGYECKLCMKPLDMDAKFPHPWSPTLDHIIPINKGGDHLYVNLQAAHFRCNTAKGDRILT